MIYIGEEEAKRVIQTAITDWYDKHKGHDFDGHDFAYCQGMEEVRNSCGDGGISEQYISGILNALRLLGYKIEAPK